MKTQLAAVLVATTNLVREKTRTFRRQVRRQISKRVFERQHAETVKQLTAALIPFFAKQVDGLVDLVVAGKSTKAFLAKENDRLVDIAFPILARGMSSAAVAQLMQMGVDIRIRGKKSTASDWLESSGNEAPPGVATDLPEWMVDKIGEVLDESFDEDYWEGISETTLDDVKQAVKSGAQEGESIRTIAERVKEKLNDEYYYGRSRSIARTEVGGSLNAARAAGLDALREEIPQIKFKKEWLSVLGTTTRETHAHLDGVPEDKNRRWYLGGVYVPYPGHKNLPPGERINCQCTLSVAWGMDDAEAIEQIQAYNVRVEEWGKKKGLCPTEQGIKYPGQPRDDHGRFGSGSSGANVSGGSGGGVAVGESDKLNLIRLAAALAESTATSDVRTIDKSRIIKDKPLSGGTNESRVIKYRNDDGTEEMAVFKPIDGERTMLKEFRDVPLAHREVAAHIIDDTMGLGLVAKAELASIDGRVGSLSKWVNSGAKVATLFLEEDGRGIGGLDNMLYFDALIGNVDRHYGNWLVKDNKARLIDNAYSFATNEQYALDAPGKFFNGLKMHPEAREAIASMGMSNKFKDGLERLIKNKEAVWDHFKKLGFSYEATEAVFRRANFLRNDPTLDFTNNTHQQIAQRSQPIVLEDLKGYNPNQPRDDHGRFGSNGGVITDPKIAAKAIAEEVVSWIQKMKEQGRTDDAPSAAEIEANWLKVFRARKTNEGGKAAFTDLNQELKQIIARGMDENESNPVFSNIMDKHGRPPVIFRRPEVGSSCAAEWRGGIHVYDGPFWKTESEHGPLKPGGSTASSSDGYSGLLRHEYGHKIYGSLTNEQQRTWVDMMPDTATIQKDVTSYAGKNKEEAFCEIFALATHKDYRPGIFPPWVDNAFQTQKKWMGVE